MYISEHSGHHQASIALEKAILRKDPGAITLNINAFRHVNPVMEKIIHKAYMKVIKQRLEIWGYLYDNPKVIKKTAWIRNFVNDSNSKKIGELIRQFKPDVVACTQAFPCGVFANYKKRNSDTTPLVGILTDYAPHAYWIYDNVDAYVVPSDNVGHMLADKGVNKKKIKTLGVPIDPVFAERLDNKKIREGMNISPALPVVLVMGGTHGIGPDEKLIKALDASKKDFQIIVITGINKPLFKQTKDIAAGSKKRIIALGFVTNVHELMEIADVIITKPGGLTTAEALAKSLPMIIVNPLPGQEAFNTRILVSAGMAVKAESRSDSVRLLENLLDNPAEMDKMKEAMKIYAKPNSADDIADFLLNLAN
jgi:processive 1,2-diacylglycerol beta-glucosyltransferase